MAWFFFLVLLALGAGAWLSVRLADDPGYVLITFQGYALEASLVTMLLSILLLFVLFFGLLWLARVLNPLRLFRRDTWRRRFNKKQRHLSDRGLELLLLGRMQEAYRNLVESAPAVQNPLFNYLAAAYAAWQRNDIWGWKFCLQEAEKVSPESAAALKSLQARLDFREGRLDQSLALLLALKKEAPDSPAVLKLLHDIYLAFRDWDKLENLLPELESKRVLKDDELQSLQGRMAVARFEALRIGESRQDRDKAYASLQTIWNALPRKLRAREDVAALYIRKLMELDKAAEAEDVLGKQLRRQWSDRLVELLGQMRSKEPKRQLLLLEGWLRERPNNASLLLSAGRLCLQNELWGRAREYFENALRCSGNTRLSAEINAELGRLLQHLDEQEGSLQYYEKAMSLLEKQLPDLPMPGDKKTGEE